MRHRNIKGIISFLVLAGLIWGALNFQNLRDKVELSSYTPSAEIAAIAKRTTMTDKAKGIFYATDPSIDGRVEFNANCPQREAGLNVLGCYRGGFLTAGRINLFRIEDERLVDEIDVTAAHEMLHAAYQRLSFWERENLDDLLKNSAASVPPAELTDVIKGYIASGNYNELHSHLGTEYSDLPKALEDHYRQYFAQRDRIVAIHLGNEALFDACESDSKSLKSSIDATKASIDSYRAQLDSIRSEMDGYKASGETSRYNALVPRHNQLVNLHNTAVRRYNSLISSYNSLANRCNALNLSLDSHLDPIPSR